MRLFLAIAVIAVLTIIVLAIQRRGPRVTTITRRRDKRDEGVEE
jgi:hypothetical protein